MKQQGKVLASVLVVFAVAGLVAWVGSQNGLTVAGVPVFALAVGLVFGIQVAVLSRPGWDARNVSTTSPEH